MKKEDTTLPPSKRHPHYYGDLIRRDLFIAALVIMIAALLDAELRTFYLYIGLFGVVGFTILAGLTSPQKRSVMFLDTVVSAVMFLIFEYFAINAFVQYGNFTDPVFFLRQTIAVIFLITLYYSTKTMRFIETEVEE